MQVLDENRDEFELKIESLDDLWVLSEFISPNDRIFATTSRKVKIGNDKTKQVTKIIFVDLLVKKVSFDSIILRVSGEIQNETEFTAIGQAQTLNFVINDKIKIKKNNLLDFERKLLERSVNSKNSKYLLVVLDKDELFVAEFNDYNYKVFFHENGLGNKKYIKTEINEDEQKYKLIEDYLKRDYSGIIFAGPGIYKNKLSDYIKSKLNKDIIIFQYPEVNSSSISKIIKEIFKKGILAENEVGRESYFIEELLKNISKGNKYVYGFNNVIDSILSGSIKELLISSRFLEEQKESGNYVELNNYMRQVEKLNGDLVIINSKNDPGKVLDGLGGIAGILRY